MHTDDLTANGRAAPFAGSAWLRRALSWLTSLFPPAADVRRVVTRAPIDAAPAEAWRRIAFYEDIPQRPSFVLRMLAPVPLRTSKPGLRVGATVDCTYAEGGTLTKRITVVEPPSLLRFVVVDQRLGIEAFVNTMEGSYEVVASPTGSEVALTTVYRGSLRPRWLWSAPERWLAGQLHRHILRGMGARI
ncbi:MAG: SRPBCC family protein [Burkholderiales bacterium]